MAYEKILAADARDKFNEAVALATQAGAQAQGNRYAQMQMQAINAYFTALFQNSRWNTKGINDILERLDRLETQLTNKHGMITTLR